jgi:hypothetical protein
MVPTRPFPGRLALSNTLTAVPIRASVDSKTFTPSSYAVRGQSPFTGETWNLTPTAFLSQIGFIA